MEKYIFSRHSKKPDKDNPESAKYPGLSEAGVEQARKEKAAELKRIIDEAPEKALVFIGAVSELIRTHSTARLYAEGLKELYGEEGDVVVLTKEDVDLIRKGKRSNSLSKGIEELAEFINNDENKNKKIVLANPFFIKQFSLLKRWPDEYYDYLEEKYGDDEIGFMKEWFETKGDPGIKGLKGPNPDKIAEEYLFGLERLKEVVKKYLKDRPIVMTSTSHAPDLDAVIIKLINGEVSPEAINSIMGKEFLGTNEGADVTIEGNKMQINFRGKAYEVEASKKNSK